MAKITLGEKYYIHSCVITGLLFLFYLLGVNNSFLYSSILDYKNMISEPFDGTVYPIDFVPSPLLLTYEQRKQNYEKIDSKYFIKTPTYNPKIFGKDLEALSPGSKDYYEVITQRVLYTVPYMGSYNFDYQEFVGSHPGVDIVVPEGTPVKNIAHGVVVDVGNQPGGFGNYVLIKHNAIPLPNRTKGNAYSLYAHMMRSTVELGTKIKKGQLVGYVGQTGTATTPHLHFQMDAESAPYSPYWPFSTLDMKLAGVGFFEGVNIGLGKENAIRYTIHPLKFVNDYLNGTGFPPLMAGTDSENNETPVETVEDISKQEEEKKDEKTSPDEEKNEPVTSQENQHDMELGTQIIIESDSKIVKKEQMVSKSVELLSTISPEIVLGDNAILKGFDSQDLLALDNSDLSESLEKVDDTITSPTLDIDYPVIDPKENQSSGVIDSEIPIDSVTQTQENNTGVENLPASQTDIEVKKLLFEDISDDYKYFRELQYFKQKSIVSGFKDGTFRPKNNITRAESLKMILLAFDIQPIKDEAAQFKDIATQSWENTYVNAAIKKKIISLENTYFSPMRNVSRIEGLKLILLLSEKKLEIEKKEKIVIEDMEESHWAQDYVQYALQNNLLSLEKGKIYPDKPLTREEIITILYQVLTK